MNDSKRTQEPTTLSKFRLYYEELPSSDKPTARNGGVTLSAPRRK